MTFGLYTVEGVDRPLRISPEHAKLIGATPHVDATEAKPGTKAALVKQAEALGVSTDGTKADLEARIAAATAPADPPADPPAED